MQQQVFFVLLRLDVVILNSIHIFYVIHDKPWICFDNWRHHTLMRNHCNSCMPMAIVHKRPPWLKHLFYSVFFIEDVSKSSNQNVSIRKFLLFFVHPNFSKNNFDNFWTGENHFLLSIYAYGLKRECQYENTLCVNQCAACNYQVISTWRASFFLNASSFFYVP